MPKNEDGEFELILANRQLLSVFFIVVVLFGVFFTMGYIVGRNSGPAQVDVASTHKTEAKPIVVDSPAPQETSAPASAPPATTPAPVSTRPQQPPEEAKVEPKPVPRREEPKKKEAPAPKEKPAPSTAAPAAGQTYLQLVATAKAEADVMVDVLHQKNFKAIAVQIPEKPELYRVLVGPLADGTLNKVKSDLQSSGFPGDKAIKKVY
ncbi:MAG TPA: SPOR domain-containing protein [Bryobacteraceae bacterium]|nr:SPOR domain-containing protein [Bryobacteraceae bacterium]